MNYLQAISSAPADADYILIPLSTDALRWDIVERHDDGELHITFASLSPKAKQIAVLGLIASHKSLWDAGSQQFLCGTADQLTRQEWPENLSEAVEY